MEDTDIDEEVFDAAVLTLLITSAIVVTDVKSIVVTALVDALVIFMSVKLLKLAVISVDSA